MHLSLHSRTREAILLFGGLCILLAIACKRSNETTHDDSYGSCFPLKS